MTIMIIYWQCQVLRRDHWLQSLMNWKVTGEYDALHSTFLCMVKKKFSSTFFLIKFLILFSARLSNRLSRRKDAASDNDMAQSQLDGGYGWCVVFGAFSVQFWVAGLVKSYGVLFVEILEIFSSSSTAVASWIPAILSALCLALAPLSSALCQRFSCRIVVFIGGLFCALGLMLSYFATSLYHLLFTFGILTGT